MNDEQKIQYLYNLLNDMTILVEKLVQGEEVDEAEIIDFIEYVDEQVFNSTTNFKDIEYTGGEHLKTVFH